MPELVLLKPATTKKYYKITITNNGSDINNETISIPIPDNSYLAQYIQSNQVDYNDFVAYDPSVGKFLPTWVSGHKGVSRAFSYIRYWTKITINSGETKDIWLVYAPEYRSAYYTPSSLFAAFATSPSDYSSVGPQGYVTSDTTDFITPPESTKARGNPNSDIEGKGVLSFTTCSKMVMVVYFKGSNFSGHPIVGRTGDNSTWAGPYTWVGSSNGPWLGPGPYIGYYDTNYHVLGQINTTSWNEELLEVDLNTNSFNFYLNGNLLRSNLPFIRGYGSWSVGSNALVHNGVYYNSANYDDAIIYCTSSFQRLSFSYDDKISEINDITEAYVMLPLDRY